MRGALDLKSIFVFDEKERRNATTKTSNSKSNVAVEYKLTHNKIYNSNYVLSLIDIRVCLMHIGAKEQSMTFYYNK